MTAWAGRSSWSIGVAIVLAILQPLCVGTPEAWADESGASVWLPGQFASFAAVPGDPGLSLELLYYHRQASAAAGRTFPVGGSIVASIATTENYVFVTPTYTFADPVLHGQLALGVTFLPGTVDTSIGATLTGPGGNGLSAGRSDVAGGMGDVYPLATLKWNAGSQNFMAYTMGSIPAGVYDPNRLAGLGVGHWAIDGGFGYTFANTSGIEASVTLGLTYNFVNPQTQYQSGLDGHLDWGASYSPTESLYLGAVGYFYNQLGPDGGPGARLGAFESKVIGVGPQIGYAFSIGHMQLDVNLRGYAEFAAENRPGGWNIWFTLGLQRAHATGR